MADTVTRLAAPKRMDCLVFDFDSTLFDTEKKKQGFYAMAECHGYSRAEAKAMYDQSRAQGNRMMISIAGFLSVLRANLHSDGRVFQSKEVSEIIERMNKGTGLLPGARALLEFCRRHEIPRFLLSLGVREWQAEKVVKSGVDAYFAPGDIVYTDILDTGKIEILFERFGRAFDGTGVVLFNDKPDETAAILRVFPKLFAYVRREPRDDRYGDADFAALAHEFGDRVAYADDMRAIGASFVEAWNKRQTRNSRARFEAAFIDFDDTIYNTHKMARDMKALFAEHGVSHADFDRTFLLAVHGNNRDYFNYTFDLHLEILRGSGYALPVDELRGALMRLLGGAYEDPEAREFLERLRQLCRETILLTAGNSVFQRERLAATGLGSYFDDVVVIQERKERALGERVRKDERYVFVNDDVGQNKTVHEQFPNVLVLTKRHPVKYSEAELQQSGLPYFSTLKDVLFYLEKHYV